MRKRLQYLILALGALAIVASCFVHQAKGNGLDFAAYYKAAQRALEGESFYVDEASYAFKYAPVTISYFIPFGLLPYSTARWSYAFLHTIAALLIPWLLLRLIPKNVEPFWGLFFALLASFRFIDGEFRDSNVGLFVALSLLLGTLLLRNARFKSFGPVVIALGAVVKVHSLLGALAFEARNDPPTRRALFLSGFILFLIPSPLLWISWWEQMRATAVYTTFSPANFTLQGFYPFSAYFLGLNPLSHICLLTALPFGLLAWKLLPRFSLDSAAKDLVRFFLTLGSWVLLGLMSSPLPWQHTYSFIWAVFPLAYWTAKPKRKLVLAGIALFLAITPRDIIGNVAFSWLESRQSVFFAILIFWLSTVFQVRCDDGQKGTSCPI